MTNKTPLASKSFVRVAGSEKSVSAGHAREESLTKPAREAEHTDTVAVVHNLKDDGPVSYLREHIDLGVLGGMGPQATQYFVEELLKSVEVHCQPRRDQDYPNVIVRYACYLPDRTAALEGDLEPFAKAFMSEAEALLELGCPQIVVPCITAHAVIASSMCHLPVVDIPRIVASYLRRERPQARIGVLATRGARLAGVIDKFEEDGKDVVTLPLDEEIELMSLIYQKAKTWRGLKDLSQFGEFADRLRSRGCDLVVAGCTEVEMCLARSGRGSTDLVFPLQIVAEAFSTRWRRRTNPRK